MDNDLKLVYNYQKELTLLFQTISLLNWDQVTYMPSQGIKSRSEQLALLHQLLHHKTNSDELFSALRRLRKTKLSKENSLMVKKLYKKVLKSRKIPETHVKELSRIVSLAYTAWEKAREKNNFKIFEPYLEKIIKLKQKECKLIKERGHPYNSLLDHFEEGMTVEKLKPILENLKNDLIKFVNEIKKSKKYKKQKKIILEKNFPIEKQRKLCEDVIKRIGLSNDSSRLDLSTHPFTETLGTNDVRITTNFRKYPLFSFESTIHETGHALYEINLPKKYSYNILGNSASLGIHESQSRFWENMIGKNKLFWKYYHKIFNKEFNLKFSLDAWYKEVNLVKPSLIRIESDEVTYCLHVILRFEIELALIEGSIKVEDLPKIWNKKMQEYLKIIPKNYKEGVLQDVHWSQGAIGYFPTYIIGTIYASQLYSQLAKEKPEIRKQIENGNFSQVSLWLKNKVHNLGNTITAEEIIKKTCKEGLNPKAYIKYLNEKYSEIYGLN